jgi:hypothetical protein
VPFDRPGEHDAITSLQLGDNILRRVGFFGDLVDPGEQPATGTRVRLLVSDGELKDELRREDWSFENVILRSKGLTAKSWLLRRAIDDLKEDSLTARERQNVLLKKKQLEDILQNREYEYRQREVGTSFKVKVWDRVGEGRLRQRLFSLGTDRAVRWCWIDFDKEWP